MDSEVITNIIAMTNQPAFQQTASWTYNSSAGTYFWAGFTLVFVTGLIMWGVKVVRQMIGQGLGD